jgi:hypothetical protein
MLHRILSENPVMHSKYSSLPGRFGTGKHFSPLFFLSFQAVVYMNVRLEHNRRRVLTIKSWSRKFMVKKMLWKKPMRPWTKKTDRGFTFVSRVIEIDGAFFSRRMITHDLNRATVKLI